MRRFVNGKNMLASHMHRYYLILLTMLAPASLSLPAQTTGNWDAVRHFAANQPIRVSLADARSFQGTARAQQTVARADITKVAN